VTMTTIGYGDMSPRTTPGRFVAFLLSIWGAMFVSFAIVAFSTFTEINERERRAFRFINRLCMSDE